MVRQRGRGRLFVAISTPQQLCAHVHRPHLLTLVQMERLWGGSGDEEDGGMTHPALLTTSADGVLRLWVEVRSMTYTLVELESFRAFVAHPAVLTTGTDGVQQLWVEVQQVGRLLCGPGSCNLSRISKSTTLRWALQVLWSSRDWLTCFRVASRLVPRSVVSASMT